MTKLLIHKCIFSTLQKSYTDQHFWFTFFSAEKKKGAAFNQRDLLFLHLILRQKVYIIPCLFMNGKRRKMTLSSTILTTCIIKAVIN